MQLDDLMIDKKSFQMEGLITSLASCIDVKLTHNELYLLIKSFFDLNNQIYGNLEDIRNSLEKDKDDYYFISKITLENILLEHSKYNLLNEYYGTFNLELARKKEEIDFLALGHPLINNILDYCISEEFQGNFSILNLKKQELEKFYNIKSIQENQLYLFIFTVKFQGYIIENQMSAIVVDENGNEVENFAEVILNIKNFNEIFIINRKNENASIKYNLIDTLQQKVKSIVKSKTSIWKKEIKNLNDNIFEQEKRKKEKIYSHKRRTLNLKRESLKLALEQKKNQKPTVQQLRNIEKITNAERKQERLNRIKKINEEIKFIDRDIKLNERKLDDLAFEYEDLTNEMIKRNKSKFYTNLLSFALLKIVD